MSSSLLEQARTGHEELELGERKIVKILGIETKTHKQKLMQQHKVRRSFAAWSRPSARLRNGPGSQRYSEACFFGLLSFPLLQLE
jgi:hypothetical protein